MGGGASKTRVKTGTVNVTESKQPRKKPALPHVWSTAMDYEQGQVNIVHKMLVEKLSLNHARSMDGLTPLVVACRDGYHSVVEALLSGNADVNLPCTEVGGIFPLVTAAEMGHSSIVSLLLQNQAEIDKRTPADGESALAAASRQGHVACVMELLSHAASVDVQTTDGATPLFEAAAEGHTQVVDVLLDSGSEVDTPLITNNSTPLIVAATMGHVDVVDALLAHEANTDTTVSSCGHWEDVTPLMSAATFGHTQVVKALLRGKAHTDPIVPPCAVTPLMAAAMGGHAEIVQVLLAQNADANLTTSGPLWTLKKCPNSHVLLQFPAREEAESVCSVCHASPEDLGVLVYSCVSCHFVVCPECTERITKQHKEPPWCVESGSTAAEIALAFGHRSLSTKFTR